MTIRRRRHQSGRERVWVRVSGGGLVHYLDAETARIDRPRDGEPRDALPIGSGARVVEGLFATAGREPVHAAVKLAARGAPAGDHVRAEHAAYRAVERAASAAGAPMLTPEVFGYRRTRSSEILVLERGLFSLDTLIHPRHGIIPRDPRPPVPADLEAVPESTTRMLAILAAATLLRTVGLLRNSAGGRTMPLAHGDLRPENLLAVQRDGLVEVVVADWGSSYTDGDRRSGRQPRPDLSVRAPEVVAGAALTFASDLWSAAFSLWQLLHQGYSPCRAVPGGEYLRRDDPRLARGVAGLIIDTEGCIDGHCILDGGQGEALHRLIAQILECGPDVEARLRCLDAPAGEGADSLQATVLAQADHLLDEQRDGEFRRRSGMLLTRVLHYTDVVNRDASGRGWMPPPPPTSASMIDLEPRRRRGGIRALLRSPATISSLRAAALGVTIGLIAALVPRLPVVTLPDPRTEFEISAWVAMIGTGLSIIAAAGAGLLARGVPRTQRTHPILRWSPVAAGSAALTAWVAVSIWARTGPWSPASPATWLAASAPLVAGAAGLLALSVHALVVTAVDRRVWSQRAGALGRITWFTGGALAVAAIATVVISALLPPATVSAVASARLVAAGMPENAPLFFNPDDLAIADDGTIAVLERLADEADVVWIKKDDESWRAAVRVPHRRVVESSAADDTAGDIFERLDAAISALLPTGDQPGVPTGDPVTGLSALDFLSPTQLAASTPEGIALIDLSATRPAVQVIAPGVRVDRYERRTDLLVGDGRIYASEVDEDALAEAHSGALATWRELPACDGAWSVDDPTVVVIDDPTGSATVGFPRWAGSDGSECRRNLWNLVDRPDGAAAMEHTTTDMLVLRPFSASEPTDLFDTFEGHVGEAVESHGRFLVKVGECLEGYALADGAAALPTVFDRSWTSSDTAQFRCYTPGTAGFLGETVEPAAEPDDADGATSAPEGSTTQPGSDAPPRDSCVPPSAGRARLDVYEWEQKAMATGPDGTIYLASDAGPRCTPIIWTLGPSDREWVPVAGAISLPSDQAYGVTTPTTMAAAVPSAVGEGVSWLVPGAWRVFDSDGGVRWFSAGATNSYRSFTPRPVAFGRGTVVLTVPSDGADTPQVDPVQTKVVIDRSLSDNPSYEFALPNGRDISAVKGVEGADRAVLAVCDAIVTFDPADLGADDTTSGVHAPPEDRFTVVVGDPARTVVGAGADQVACGPVSEAAKAAHSATDVPLRPGVVDATMIDGGLVVAYAEAGIYDGAAVSRVRIADPSGVLERSQDTGDRVFTLGCDAGAAKSACSGDLSDLGLEASDIAVRSDGVVAVSTISAEGWGPVLVYGADGRSVVRLDPSLLVSGVAWLDDELVVTDAARGDVFALTLPGLRG